MSATFDAAKIRLADKPPVACASCYAQVPSKRHVDFGAAYDGLTLPPGPDVVGGTPLSIDDLIICEDCLRAAAKLVDLTDQAELASTLNSQAEQLQTMSEKLAGAMALINRLESAAAERDKLEDLLKPKPRKKA